jgi:hypothetical protein
MWYVCWASILAITQPQARVYSPRTSLTGATFNDVPMINSRSTFSLSANRQVSNSESSAWPKKVMSGYTSATSLSNQSMRMYAPS